MARKQTNHFETEYRVLPQLTAIMDALADSVSKSREKWLDDLCSKHLPPEIYLRAYGNNACKHDVAQILQEQGFILHKWPDREEAWRGDELLGVWHHPHLNYGA